MLLLLSSCEGLLEKNPISDIPTTDMWKSQDDATAWIAGTYDGLQTTFQSNFWIWGEIRADNFRSTGTSTTSARILGNTISADDASTTTQVNWSDLYTVISRCNSGIKNLPIMISQNIGGGSSTYKDYLGQCYGLRAMMYFYGIRVWGRMPLIVTPIETANQSNFARDSINLCKKQILSDLNNAINDLNTTDKKYYFSLGAAYALKADVHMWFHEFDSAYVAITNLENLKLYSWVTNSTDWKSIFLTPETSKEAIFSLYFNSLQDIKGNSYGALFAPNGNTASYTLSGDMYQILINHNVAGQSYDARHALCIDTLSAPTASTYTPLTSTSAFAFCKFYPWDKTFKRTADIRLGGFVIDPGAQCNAKTPLIRYADVMLMKAEILCRRGSYQSALDIVNLVRKRVGYKVVLLSSFTNPAVDVFNCIMDERRVELLCEGKRWFDIIRAGSTYDSVNEKPSYEYLHQVMDPVMSIQRPTGNSFTGVNEGRVLFPINSKAFSANPLLRGDQNPPYSE